jgi:hypothetical protein
MKIEAKSRLLIARSGVEHFENTLLNKAKSVVYKARDKVIEMSIKDFLRMALPIRQEVVDKSMHVKDLLEKKTRFSSLPYIYFYVDGKTARVTGHEGRHRALALLAMGYTTMPVDLRGPIRWSEQTDSARFDYLEEWPSLLVSEDGSKTMPFPVTREKANVGLQARLITAAGKYDHIDFTPPKGAQDAAKRALEVRKEKPESQRGMTPTGIARARDLSNGKSLSPETVRRMKSFFERHEVDKKGASWGEHGRGWQAWMGWGGDAGFSWSQKVCNQMDRADEK